MELKIFENMELKYSQVQNKLDTSGLLTKLPHVFDDVVWRDFQGHHRLFVTGADDEDANLVRIN